MNSHALKIVTKRIKKYNQNKKIASKSSVKLKLGPRFKFWPFHFYRKILVGLASDRTDLFGGEKKWKPKGSAFGTHRVSWREWNTRIKKICPIQYYLREDFPYDVRHFFKFYKLQNWCYYLKCLLFKRYNVLKLKKLPPTWVDEDELLVHAMFAVIERFMDEKPDTIINYDSDKEHKLFWKEINEAWKWWKNREAFQKRMDKALHKCVTRKEKDYFKKYKEYNALEKQFEEEESKMLGIIIKHRKMLWV